ncbi:unnamed protein product [Echinostoma caproni]|uniref:RanBP2-type domain-containing protein n=1 Tax=Echinostoma caproni TaxID=27848 RepID=A0A3P8F448_9TREM|nr:unnamed protein product [Echinostoma caproni]
MLRKLGPQNLYTCLANFHLLAWLANYDQLPLALHEENGHWVEEPQGITGLLDAIALASRANEDDQPSVPAEQRIKLASSAVSKWAGESSAWATVNELVRASDSTPSPPPHIGSTGSSVSGSHNVSTSVDPTLGSTRGREPAHSNTEITDSNFWACPHCTYHNELETLECEMCGLPRHA